MTPDVPVSAAATPAEHHDVPPPLLITARQVPQGLELTHPSYGSTTLSGAILAEWTALHAAADAFGSSVQDVLGAPLGKVQRYTEGGKPAQAQAFERGMIVVRPDGRCVAVYGAIYARYLQLGGITGPLGWPAADEAAAANGGRVSAFDGGSLYWSVATGAKLVKGGILAKYTQMGAASSYLGLPIADEQPVMAGNQTLGYCSLFAGGGIWWTQAFGARDMPAYVVEYWREHGGPTGLFGLPTDIWFDVAGSTLAEFEKGVVAFTPSGPIPFFGLDLYLGQFESNFDDIHVEVNLDASGPDQHEHFWVPSSGYAGNPNADHHFRIGTLRLATEVSITATGYGDHSFGKDERLGTFKATYNAHNVWGVLDQQTQTSAAHPATENVNSDFHFTTQVSIQTQGIFNSQAPRRSLWWPFHNFDTPFLSQHQMAQTFTDVSEDETNFWHPFDNLFYKYVYQHSASMGTCFGMCLEAIYARVGRSVFAEPIFDNALIGYPAALACGKALDDPSVPSSESARFMGPCQIKFGYQLGHPTVDFAIGKYLSGGAHDAVAAFRESRDAYAAGNYPIMSLTQGGLGSAGHAVMPYRWDDAAKPWRIWVANPNAPAADVPSDDDRQNVIFIDPDANTFRFVAGLGQGGKPDTYAGGRDGPGMIMSLPFHLLCYEPSTPFWEVVAALAAGTLLLLVFTGDDGSTTQIADGHGRAVFDAAHGASAGKPPALKTGTGGRADVAPVPLFNPPPAGGRTETYRINHPIPFRKAGAVTEPTDLPDASLAYTHQVASKGAYQWGIKGPGGSTMVAMSAASGEDVFKIEQIGRPGQSVSVQAASSRLAGITLCGGLPGEHGLRLYELSSVPVGPSHAVTAHLEAAGEQLVVQNGGDDATVTLRVQTGGGKDSTSVSKPVMIPAGAVARLRPETWESEKLPHSAIVLDVLDRVGGAVIRTIRS